jgi:hypothetical protein
MNVRHSGRSNAKSRNPEPQNDRLPWMPAFAGMTAEVRGAAR